MARRPRSRDRPRRRGCWRSRGRSPCHGPRGWARSGAVSCRDVNRLCESGLSRDCQMRGAAWDAAGGLQAKRPRGGGGSGREASGGCSAAITRITSPERAQAALPQSPLTDRRRATAQTRAGDLLPLAEQLARELRHRLLEIERGGEDAVLLGGVGDGVALARGGPLGTPDVAEV